MVQFTTFTTYYSTYQLVEKLMEEGTEQIRFHNTVLNLFYAKFVLKPRRV